MASQEQLTKQELVVENLEKVYKDVQDAISQYKKITHEKQAPPELKKSLGNINLLLTRERSYLTKLKTRVEK